MKESREGSYYRRRGKRVLDVTLASIGLLLSLPLMTLVAAVVWLSLGRPVFFVQRRAGLAGRPFELVKFRTMTEARDTSGTPLSDGDRLVGVGRFIRRSSLDELPELWNVLKGDMSVAGPRPLFVRYLSRYTREQVRRHEVRPGITGWAQVNGRNALLWEDRFRLDCWYVDHVSLGLDLRILAKTLVSVLKRDGISAESHPTMPEFMGDRE
jgi:sugar transferase EpsL